MGTVIAMVILGGFAGLPSASSEPPSVGLGTAEPFAVLAGSAVTNTGPSVINGDLGVHPGAAVTGFPPGLVNGEVHAADAVADQAKQDLVTAYNDAAGRPAQAVATELGGNKFFAGVYGNSTELGLTGTVTLDAQNDPSSVWIFQAGSTLITASNSTVALTNGADPCNVFWQVGSSATLGTGTTFVGTILALTSINRAERRHCRGACAGPKRCGHARQQRLQPAGVRAAAHDNDVDHHNHNHGDDDADD